MNFIFSSKSKIQLEIDPPGEMVPAAQPKVDYPDSVSMMDLFEIYEMIKTEAYSLGFTTIGVAHAKPVPHFEAYQAWIEAGFHANMGYMAREDALAKRSNPQLIQENCQRIICLAFPYTPPKAPIESTPPGKGRLSAYATTQDYHGVIGAKLAQLEASIKQQAGENVQLKSYVDTGPILERSFASKAGLGNAGKNSCLIIPREGSYFFLAEILTDLPLPTDTPFTTDLCKNCQHCVDACPTDCIQPDRTIDAQRCISYLTIENKGEIPDQYKSTIGDWVFGCDICQLVCPHNARSEEQHHPLGEPQLPEFLDLLNLFSEDEKTFREKYGQTPLARTKRQGLLRNAAVVLGNQKMQDALPVLEKALQEETDPGIMDACRWAIEQIEA